MGFKLPPLDGSLPAVWVFLDWRAKHTPEDPWMIYQSPESPHETVSLTFSDCALASHKVAYGLRMTRASDQEGLVVAVLLNADAVHYTLLLTGMMRAGLVPLPISSKTPPETIFKTMESVNCHHLLTQGTACMHILISTIRTVCARRFYPLRIDDAPALDFMLPQLNDKTARRSLNVGPYPPNRRAHSSSDVVLYLQSPLSSLSHHTVPLTNSTIASWQRAVLQTYAGYDSMFPAVGIPTYDPKGILIQLFIPVTLGMPIGVFPPKAPEQPTAPTSQSTLELAKTLKCNGIITVAPFVEEWAHDDEAIQAIAKFSLVSYAGATSLSPFATDTFASAGAHLIPSNDCCVAYHAGVMFYNWNSTENDDDESLDLPEVDNPLIFALQKHSILGGKRLGT